MVVPRAVLRVQGRNCQEKVQIKVIKQFNMPPISSWTPMYTPSPLENLAHVLYFGNSHSFYMIVMFNSVWEPGAFVSQGRSLDWAAWIS